MSIRPLRPRLGDVVQVVLYGTVNRTTESTFTMATGPDEYTVRYNAEIVESARVMRPARLAGDEITLTEFRAWDTTPGTVISREDSLGARTLYVRTAGSSGTWYSVKTSRTVTADAVPSGPYRIEYLPS
jgi:hypothetical protein